MKKKNSMKKLSLSKETISALSKSQTLKIKGGVTQSGLDNCTTKVNTCCYPMLCTSGGEKTGAISGCPVCK